jgi:hypothetical protein
MARVSVRRGDAVSYLDGAREQETGLGLALPSARGLAGAPRTGRETLVAAGVFC